MSYIFTYTGKKVYPYNLQPEDFDIQDIAHALSQICRYTGHTKDFYSVAEHSVLVSLHCKKENALWGLLHDAAEAYLSDLNTPTKEMLLIYKSMEDRALRSIAKRFGLVMPIPDDVHRADLWMLQNEMRDQLGGTEPAPEWMIPGVPRVDLTQPCSPRAAKQLFLFRFAQILKEKEDDRCSSLGEYLIEQVAPEYQG